MLLKISVWPEEAGTLLFHPGGPFPVVVEQVFERGGGHREIVRVQKVRGMP